VVGRPVGLLAGRRLDRIDAIAAGAELDADAGVALGELDGSARGRGPCGVVGLGRGAGAGPGPPRRGLAAGVLDAQAALPAILVGDRAVADQRRRAGDDVGPVIAVAGVPAVLAVLAAGIDGRRIDLGAAQPTRSSRARAVAVVRAATGSAASRATVATSTPLLSP
jgi:hypothetical protein